MKIQISDNLALGGGAVMQSQIVFRVVTAILMSLGLPVRLQCGSASLKLNGESKVKRGAPSVSKVRPERFGIAVVGNGIGCAVFNESGIRIGEKLKLVMAYDSRSAGKVLTVAISKKVAKPDKSLRMPDLEGHYYAFKVPSGASETWDIALAIRDAEAIRITPGEHIQILEALVPTLYLEQIGSPEGHTLVVWNGQPNRGTKICEKYFYMGNR